MHQENIVTTYLTRDLVTGEQIVVNFTDKDSNFAFGFVARTVSNGMIKTYGEGTNLKQSPLTMLEIATFNIPAGEISLAAQYFLNKWVWEDSANDILGRCDCQK